MIPRPRKTVGVLTALFASALLLTVSCGQSASQAPPAAASPAPTTASGNEALDAKYPGCAQHLQDGATAQPMQMTNIRGIRYGEISLLCDQSGASMYNTTGLNNQANPMDTAPAALWDPITQDGVAQQYAVPNSFKNGPRFWVNDWINLPVGPQLDFNGLKARWFAYPNYPPDVQNLGITANKYKSNDIARNSTMGFVAGQSVYVLTDPNNVPYIMQAGSSQVNASETIQSLPALGSVLTLPSGWKYQVIPLTKELVISAVNGTAKVTTDDQGNSYDQCFETACSYNPLTGQ